MRFPRSSPAAGPAPRTHWTPLRVEPVPAWGARALPPGPTMLTARE